MKKNEKQKTIKKTNDLKKNKAEKFIVCLSWLLGVALLSAILVVIFYPDHPHRKNFADIVMNALIFNRRCLLLSSFFFFVLFLVFYIVAKKKTSPYVRPKYYRNLMILILLILFVLSFEGYVIDYIPGGYVTIGSKVYHIGSEAYLD